MLGSLHAFNAKYNMNLFLFSCKNRNVKISQMKMDGQCKNSKTVTDGNTCKIYEEWKLVVRSFSYDFIPEQ